MLTAAGLTNAVLREAYLRLVLGTPTLAEVEQLIRQRYAAMSPDERQRWREEQGA